MRIAVLGLQGDIDRELPELVDRDTPSRRLGAYPQHVLFADIEIHIDRIERHDGRKLGRRRRTDQFADRDQMRTDDAVERRHHIGIAVIDRRDLGVDLGLLQICLGVVA